MIETSERVFIGQVIDRLAGMYPGVPLERVSEVVVACYSRFDGRPIRDYVPLFVERIAREQLAKEPRDVVGSDAIDLPAAERVSAS